MAESNDGSSPAGAPENIGTTEPAATPPASAKPAPKGAARAGRRGQPARPARPSRSARHPAVTIGSGIFTFLLFVFVGMGLVGWYGQRAFTEPGPLTAEKVVLIPRGAGVRDMAEILQREGVVENWLVFVAGQKLGRPDANLKAGEYLFKPGQSVASVIDTIASGKVVLHQVTIPEGLTSQQVVKRLMDNELLTGTPAVPQEGTLLPETYRIHRGMTRDEVLQQMAEAQRKLLATIWAKRAPDLPVKSPQELVTLASIVEKETGQADERPKVAAVFVNRLNKKMRLQSDPTIIYGIVGGRGSLGRPISRTDIATATAYNTYAIDGLPPGPICNPGRDALAAVANPLKTKDLFFVADGTGGHAFAETLADHNKNVARWRAIEQGNTPAATPGTSN
ncbi:endolytic transglycosylase MltG [Xanthobacter autotrophicus]|uniref:endolytic transglycosylase MltG n=1 Tax=Xanthobacter TaxID=279 RepID=UPI0024AAA7F9|nr:endolytic transglycosylase MltG [Xanthobacter autotrophicus]MDI4664399.1 endolytic transglycosylase MltG [Xanthobacter autotrophicus]